MQNKIYLLSIGEAAEYLGVSIDTLRRWEKRKRIEPLRSPGGHRYFNKKDLDNLFGKKYSRDNLIEFKKIKSIIPELKKDILIDKEKEQIFNNFTPPEDISFVKYSEVNIIERPVRDIKIPFIEPIRVITTKNIESSIQEESNIEPKNESILTPSTLIENNHSPQNQNNSINKNTQDFYIKYSLPLTILFITIIVLGILYYFMWNSSQNILSPIP